MFSHNLLPGESFTPFNDNMYDNAELSLNCSCTVFVLGGQRYATIDYADLLHSQSASLGVSLRL
jgi:hypothetical protein